MPICGRVIPPEELAVGRGDSNQCPRSHLHVLALPIEINGDGRSVGRSRTAETAAPTAKTSRPARSPLATTGTAAETANSRVRHASLKTGIRLPHLAARIRERRGHAGIDPHGRRRRRRTGSGLRLGDYFNRLDCRVFDLGRENNAKLSVGHLHRHSFDIGAVRTAGLYPNVEVFEFMPHDIVGKDPLAGGR